MVKSEKHDYHSCMKINCHVDPVVPLRQLALVITKQGYFTNWILSLSMWSNVQMHKFFRVEKNLPVMYVHFLVIILYQVFLSSQKLIWQLGINIVEIVDQDTRL